MKEKTIIHIIYPAGYADEPDRYGQCDVDIDDFFPTTKIRIHALMMRFVRSDTKSRNALTHTIVGHLRNQIIRTRARMNTAERKLKQEQTLLKKYEDNLAYVKELARSWMKI